MLEGALRCVRIIPPCGARAGVGLPYLSPVTRNLSPVTRA